MVHTLALIILGILTVIIPHFLLPLDLVQGTRNALVITYCSAWYHPEIYLGCFIAITSIFSIRFKNALIAVVLAGIVLGFHSSVLQPVSYYLSGTDMLVTLSHRSSLQSHTQLQTVLVILTVLILLFSLYPFFFSRKKTVASLSITTLSLRNIKRRFFRSVAMISALAIVIGAFFTDILLTQCIQNTLEIGASRLGADLMIVPKGEEENAQTVLVSGKPSRFYMSRDVITKLEQFKQIDKSSAQLYLRPFSYLVCCTHEDFLIVAYDPVTDFTVKPWVQYYLKGEQEKFDLVVGQSVKAYPGQSITVYGRILNIQASLDPTGIGYFDNSVFLPIEGAIELLHSLRESQNSGSVNEREEIKDLSLTHLFTENTDETNAVVDIDPGTISAVFIKLHNNASVTETAELISKAIPEISVIKVKDSTISVKRSLTSLLDALVMPIIFLIIMGTAILAVIFSMSAHEKRREIGLLRAMGAKSSQIFSVILSESLIISILGGIFGILFGGILILVFKHHIMAALNLLYIWPSLSIILTVMFLTLLLSISVGFLAGLYPSIKASKMEPYFAIRTGGD